MVVWACGILSQRLEGLAEIESFASSFVVTVIACALDKYVYDGKLCLYGQLFGGIVWYVCLVTIYAYMCYFSCGSKPLLSLYSIV